MPFYFLSSSVYRSLFRCLLLALVLVWWCSFSLACIGRVRVGCYAAKPSVHYCFVACLLLLLIDEPWCYRVDYDMLPCPDSGVLPTCTWSIRLARGCPTHYLICGRPIYVLARGCPTQQFGTWLPNTSTWHMVALNIVLHMAVHYRWSRWTSFIYAVILCDIYYSSDPVVPCAALWTYHFSYTWSGWTVYIFHQRSFTTFHAHPPDVFLLRTLLLFGREFIGTPAYSDFSMLHSMSTSFLRYLSAPHYLSWRYRIMCWRSSQPLMVLSVSIHHYVEPFVISWLSGISVMTWSQLWWLCAYSSLPNCYTHAYAQLLSGVPYVERYYDVLFVHVLLAWSIVPVFRLRTVTTMLFLLEELVSTLLHCRSVGVAWTLFYLYGADYPGLLRTVLWWSLPMSVISGRWFDDDMMILTTTADHGLHLPSFSTMPMLSGRCSDDSDRAGRCFDVSGRCRDDGSTSLMMDCCAIPGLSTTPMMGLSSPAPDSPLS